MPLYTFFSTGAAAPKKDLVIPLQKVVKWRNTDTLKDAKPPDQSPDTAAQANTSAGSDVSDGQPLSLEERAVAALKNDVEKLLNNDDSTKQIDAIPILMQNRVPVRQCIK